MPLPSFTSEQSSSRTNFSPGFGSICGATFLSPNFGYIIIAVLHQVAVQRSRVKHLPDKMVRQNGNFKNQNSKSISTENA